MKKATAAASLALCLALPAAAAQAQPGTPACDAFCHLVRANQASLVMLVEGGLVPEALGGDIARAVARIAAEQSAPGAERSADYLDFETRLIALAGPQASRIHMGRSRQDLHGTLRRMQLREALLDSLRALADARGALVDLAARHVETVVPAYTHGVQAQPTSLAHSLLAFSAAFGRDAERFEQLWARLNRSPLGAAALGTSGFALNRERLAELLGFAAPIENSLDANLVASMDSKVEFAGILALSALHVGQFVENIHTQYHDPAPWLQLDDGQTSISSIMPQKRNPRPLDRIRTAASAVLGGAHQVALYAHNTSSGMHDYRSAQPTLELAARAVRMYSRYARTVRSLKVDAERALAELNSDYSTMTEVADALLRHADVPFRTAHGYAAALARHGRAHGLRPAEIGDETLTRLYAETTGTPLPVAAALIRQAMDPRRMVADRKGLGGPQPASVRAMLAAHRRSLAATRKWLATARAELDAAHSALDSAFRKLL